MSAPRVTFKEVANHCRSTYRFFDDRIERDWKLMLRNGKVTYPVRMIGDRIDEQTTSAYGLRGTLRTLALYVLLGLVLHLGFEQPILEGIGFLFYFLAGLTAVLAVKKLKKNTWLYVKQIDGRLLFCVRVEGLKDITREEFVREIQRYAKENQPAESLHP